MPKVNIPGVGEKQFEYGLSGWVSTTALPFQNRTLMLVGKWRASRLNLSRLEVEKDALEFELSAQTKLLEKARRRGPSLTRPMKVCFFCKSTISKKARVCRECSRVQPDFYQEVAEKDVEISQAISNAKADKVDVKSIPLGRCVYCLLGLKEGAMICPCCRQFQPRFVAEIARQDLNAINISNRARE